MPAENDSSGYLGNVARESVIVGTGLIVVAQLGLLVGYHVILRNLSEQKRKFRQSPSAGEIQGKNRVSFGDGGQ